MADEQELDQDNEDTLEDDLLESGTDDGETAPPAETDTSGEAESKRISDLMSKWQKADAENARLKAQLAGAKPKNSAQDSIKTSVDSEFMEFARESTRNSLYASDPRLAKYKVPVESIAGETPAAMQESLKTQRALIDSLETQIRRDVMREHGIEAEVTSGGGTNIPAVGTMSDEDFAKLIEKRSQF